MRVFPRVPYPVSNPEGFLQAVHNLPRSLGLMGFKELRSGGQDEMVSAILSGNDCLGIMPTGGGKSATFMLPTLCWGWRTLIFSPLIALQKDQVEKLQSLEIAADRINSANTAAQNNEAMQAWMSGQLHFLFVAPERLNSENFWQMCKAMPPDFVVIDEAHSASMWAEDFRPAYKKIAPFIKEVSPQVVLACTATATPDVEKDIRYILGMQDARKIVFSYRRKNLILTARERRNWDEVLHILNQEIDGSGIVYCSAVKRCEAGMAALAGNVRGGMDIYTGKLPQSQRETTQNLFMNNTIRCMIATNAFGMGVDKPDVRGIVHFDIPGSLDSYVQEFGRAGRDGKESKCILLWGSDSVKTQQFFLDNKNPSPQDIISVFDFLVKTCTGKEKVELTGMDIAAGTGIFEMKVTTILSILTANQVIEREGVEQELGKVLLHGTGHAEGKFDRVIQAVMAVGFRESDGWTSFDIDAAAGKAMIKPVTFKKYLHELAQNSYVQYRPPFNGRTIRLLTRELDSKMDWERLRRKREFDEWRLQQMVKYATSVKDDDRHEFIEKYFKRSINGDTKEAAEAAPAGS